MANQVRIFTTPVCVYCKKAKDFFKANNIEYSEVDVIQDEKAREEMVEKTGMMAVPVIDVNGQFLVGFNEPELRKALGL